MKRVPAPGARINITADGQAIDTAFLGFTTSPHEECAVEAAVQLVEQHGGEATVLTLGPAEADEQLRYAASVGVANAVLLPIDGGDWDPQRTARAIAVGDRRSRGDRRPVRPDPVRQRVGRLRRLPGRHPCRPRARPPDGQRRQGHRRSTRRWSRVRREADVGLEVYELPMPAVVGVKEGINLPRYPTMKGRLASKKVEVAHVDRGSGRRAASR